MVKKGLLILTALCFYYGSANALPKTTSSFAINLNSGEVISSERPDVVRHPASLTKLMTLYLIFEAIEHGKLRMDTPLKISRHAVNQKPSTDSQYLCKTHSHQEEIVCCCLVVKDLRFEYFVRFYQSDEL